MKIYISSDIEGVNGIATWSETEATHKDHAYFANIMTEEIKSCCKGFNDNGNISEIYLKDAHDSGRNIDHAKLPDNVVLNRNWAKHPLCMMHGIDESFSGTVLTGYHSAGWSKGNSLAHTMSTGYNFIKVNGELASEFLLNYYISLHFKVPVIMVTGDKTLCEYVKKLDPKIVTVATKDSVGGCTISKHPDVTNKEIRRATEEALSVVGKTNMELPTEYIFEISFKQIEEAHKATFYPGAYDMGNNSVGFKTKDIMEFMTFLMFV